MFRKHKIKRLNVPFLARIRENQTNPFCQF